MDDAPQNTENLQSSFFARLMGITHSARFCKQSSYQTMSCDSVKRERDEQIAFLEADGSMVGWR